MGNGVASNGTPTARLLEGDRVLITGGSGGIGHGVAVVCAREGARVAFTWSSNEDGAAATERAIRAHGGECLAVRADVRQPDSAARVVNAVAEAWGGLDVLVNNAGVSEAVPFILIDDDELMEVLEINLVAAFRFSRSAVKHMIRSKYGRIVNVSSIAGSRSIPGPVHYAASKGALDGFTRSLAHEVGPYGVLVNAVAAGIFAGGLRATIPEHHQRRYLDACALSRVGTPDECGELVCWLASRRNTYTNGTIVFQDGGTLA